MLKDWKWLIGILMVSVFLLPISDAGWWDANWITRREIQIRNFNAWELVNFQVFLNISKYSGMKSDYSDLRFIYYNSSDGNEYLLPYWFQNYTSDYVLVWIKVPKIPANSNATLYVYYNNTNANYIGNASNVFYYFDDFNFFNSTFWNNVGSGTNYTVANGMINFTLLTWSVTSYIRSNSTFGYKDGTLIYRFKQGEGNPSVHSIAWVVSWNASRVVGTGTGRNVYNLFYYYSGNNQTALDLYNATTDLFYKLPVAGWKPEEWYIGHINTFYNTSDSKRMGRVALFNSSGLFVNSSGLHNLTFPNEVMYPEIALHDCRLPNVVVYDYLGIANYTRPEPEYSVLSSENIDITINPPSPVVYGTQTNVSCRLGNLYRNGTLVPNPEVEILPAGIWNYTCVGFQAILNVTKANLPVNLYFNGTKNANRTYPYQALKVETDYEALSWNTGIQTQLWRNNVYVGTSDEGFFPEGNYTYKVNATGNWNYTNNVTGVSYTAFVVYPPSVSIQLPLNNTTYVYYNYSQRVVPFNYTSKSPYQRLCWYSLDNGQTNVTLTGCNNITLTIPNRIGKHELTLYSKETFTNLENNTKVIFYSDFTNYWNVTLDGVGKDGYAVFSNSTDIRIFNFTNGNLFVNTSQLPFGDVIANFYYLEFFYASKSYIINDTFNVNETIYLQSKKLKINVYDEASLNRYKYWKVILGNGTQSLYYSTGKGKATQIYEQLPFLDDNPSTYSSPWVSSGTEIVYYVQNFGFNYGKFEIIYRLETTNHGFYIFYYDLSKGDWVNVFTSRNTPGTHVDYFYINNSFGNVNCGDWSYICNNTVCPLFKISNWFGYTMSTKIYEIRLVEPYEYLQNGYATFNFTNLNISGNNIRLIFQGYGTKQRTLFISPYGLENDYDLDVYLTSECYYQPFQVLSLTTLPSQNPVPIANATLSLYRNIGNRLVLIDQQRTDETGLASLCVLQGIPYVLSVSASGYNPEVIYDTIFTQTQTLYIYLRPTPLAQNITNYHRINMTITPSKSEMYEPFNISCSVLTSEGNILYSYMNVTRKYTTSDYLNISKYPPSYSNVSNPFNYTYAEDNVYYGVSYSTMGSVFMFQADEIGIYNVKCGVSYNATDFMGITETYNKEIEQDIWLLASGMAPKGKELTKYMSPTTLYIILLVLDMVITSFFVSKFGLGSGFIFLLIWGMTLTILSGWGINIQTGLFFLGTLVWIGYIILRRGGI